jgi:hypothetical protein
MGTTPPPGSPSDARLRARAELLWYLRHADALARWPALAEPWAQRIEARRLAPDGAPGRPPDGSGDRPQEAGTA